MRFVNFEIVCHPVALPASIAHDIAFHLDIHQIITMAQIYAKVTGAHSGGRFGGRDAGGGTSDPSTTSTSHPPPAITAPAQGPAKSEDAAVDFANKRDA